MPHVSIIVVSYNTREFTLECLRSIFEQTRDVSFDVIVVDNASSDGSADAVAAEFPQVRMIRSEENVGFARANNLAAERASGEWLLLLNPDTVVLDGAIDTLVTFAKGHPEASIFGGRTLFADGTVNPTCCWARPTLWSALCSGIGLSFLFKGSRLFDPQSLGKWRRDSVREVDIVTGCFFLVPRAVWSQLDGFDEQFFMYGEEVDFCLRARQAGLKCLICPSATIIHYGGASERVRSEKMVRLFCAQARLFRKHWRGAAARMGALTLDMWALSRLAALTVAGGFSAGLRDSHATWRAIWSRRTEWRRAFTDTLLR